MSTAEAQSPMPQSSEPAWEEMISCIHKSETNDLKRQMMMVKLQARFRSLTVFVGPSRVSDALLSEVQDIWLRIRDTFLTQQEDIIREFKGEAGSPTNPLGFEGLKVARATGLGFRVLRTEQVCTYEVSLQGR